MFLNGFKSLVTGLAIVATLTVCKSGDEEPSEDYLLLGITQASVLNGFNWSGNLSYDSAGCRSVDGNITTTAEFCTITFPELEALLSENPTRITVFLPSQTPISGNVTILLNHPDANPITSTYQIPVTGTVGIGNETGNGPARSLALSQADSTAVFGETGRIQLIGFQADQQEDSLVGTLSLLIIRNTVNAVVTYSFNIDKVY